MATFNDAYDKLLINEGGYVDDPDDAGGETYKGISRKNNPTWGGWKIIDNLKRTNPNGFKKALDKNKTLQTKVRDLYKLKYWNIFELDDIPSQDIAEQMFDAAVNCGVQRAIIFAQCVLGMSATGKWTNGLKVNLMRYGKN